MRGRMIWFAAVAWLCANAGAIEPTAKASASPSPPSDVSDAMLFLYRDDDIGAVYARPSWRSEVAGWSRIKVKILPKSIPSDSGWSIESVHEFDCVRRLGRLLSADSVAPDDTREPRLKEPSRVIDISAGSEQERLMNYACSSPSSWMQLGARLAPSRQSGREAAADKQGNSDRPSPVSQLYLISADQQSAVYSRPDFVTPAGDGGKILLFSVFRTPKKNGAVYAAVNIRFDCEAQTASILSTRSYNRIGEQIASNSTIGAPTPVIPATGGDRQLRLACGLERNWERAGAVAVPAERSFLDHAMGIFGVN